LQYSLKRHLDFESRKLNQFFFSVFAGAAWLSSPDSSSPNKLLVLEKAARAGLEIPATIITTRKSDVAVFSENFKRIITKPIGEADPLVINGKSYGMYTAVLEDSDITALPDRFRASLFQEFLEKEYEIRVFYLAPDCYSMAIFSQDDEQTKTDFRRYNWKRPNRSVPYSLGPSTILAIQTLMTDLGLETGSIDLVHTLGGRDVFLEVNPVGQFGMVSVPCNYGLERKVAELLMLKESEVKHRKEAD